MDMMYRGPQNQNPMSDMQMMQMRGQMPQQGGMGGMPPGMDPRMQAMQQQQYMYNQMGFGGPQGGMPPGMDPMQQKQMFNQMYNQMGMGGPQGGQLQPQVQQLDPFTARLMQPPPQGPQGFGTPPPVNTAPPAPAMAPSPAAPAKPTGSQIHYQRTQAAQARRNQPQPTAARPQAGGLGALASRFRGFR
jgi:hypothetical protein